MPPVTPSTIRESGASTGLASFIVLSSKRPIPSNREVYTRVLSAMDKAEKAMPPASFASKNSTEPPAYPRPHRRHIRTWKRMQHRLSVDNHAGNFEILRISFEDAAS